jgi:glycosyltransferase involved in cell wall biosynthesis
VRAKGEGRVLFVSFDGMCDHISQSQVLPYVLGLAQRGWRMALISHEKPDVDRARRAATKARLEEAGVAWLPQPYRRGNPLRSLGFHLGAELLAAARQALGGRIALVHARSYIPAAAAALMKAAFGARMIFDMRGFWLDEKLDAGSWREGWAYRAGKGLELGLFGRADAIVSLTDAGRRVLERWPAIQSRHIPITVIPTCVDLAPYAELGAASRSDRDGPTLGYLGSFGARYLSDEMVDLFSRIRRRSPKAKLVILATNPPEGLGASLERHGVPEAAVEVGRVAHDAVPARLAGFDATFCLIKPGFASLASCPTKFGESLAAGVPVVVNTGVGDCAEVATRSKVGVATDLDRAGFDRVADALLELLAEGGGAPVAARCRAVAAERFDLSRAVDAYEGIYRELRA